jgi:hypothetical protein
MVMDMVMDMEVEIIYRIRNNIIKN